MCHFAWKTLKITNSLVSTFSDNISTDINVYTFSIEMNYNHKHPTKFIQTKGSAKLP